MERKDLCLAVESRPDTTGVEGLNGIYQRGDFQKIGKFPVTAAQAVERMRNADKGALGAQTLDCFLGRQTGRNFFLDIGRQDFAACGHNFLANDDSAWVEPAGMQSTGDGVVVGDYHAVDAFLPAGDEQILRMGQAVF